MKKILLIAVLMIASFNVMNAQITFGARAGLNLGSVSGYDQNANGTGYTMSLTTGMGTGFHIGAVMNYNMTDNWAYDFELLYTTVNFKETVNFTMNFMGQNISTSGTGKAALNYIQIPFIMKYSLVKDEGLNFSAGTYAGFLIGASSTSSSVDNNGQLTSNTSSSDSAYNKLDWGIIIGAGYQLPMGLGFDLRYNMGFLKDMKATTDGMGNTMAAMGTHSNLMISVKYMFGMGK